MISVSIIVPIYEEDRGVLLNINNLISRLKNLSDKKILKDYEVLIFLSRRERLRFKRRRNIRSNRRIRLVNHNGDAELGSIFSRGVGLARKEFIGLIPPYNQVALESLDDIFKALSFCDMVVTYIGNHSARPWYRAVISLINTGLVNLLFGLSLNYYHLNFYRSALVKKVRFTTDSHAAMVEAAVWLAKSGVSLTQVPFVMIPHNFKSKSRVFRISNFFHIFATYVRLFWRVRVLRERINIQEGIYDR